MAAAANASYTDDNIRQQVRICLMKIKKDDAFMESQLHASDYECINKDDKIKYNLFLHYVSMSLMNNKHRKASKFVDQRLKKSDVVQNEIEEFDPDTYVPEDPPVMGSKIEAPPKQKKKAKATKTDKLELDDDEISADENKDNKKRPRSKSSSTQKKPSKGGSGNNKKKRVSIKFSKKERRQYSEDAKSEFITIQNEILEHVPEEHSKHWGEIVFGKWKKDPHRPVVLLGPYGVPPGELRDTWVKMFENTKGDPKRMWYWCFWYGAPLAEAYTQQKFKDFTSFESATKRNLIKLPDRIKDKVDKGKKISKVEEQTIAGFKCLEAELTKKPEERCAGLFSEEYENILNLNDEVSLADESMDDIDSMDSESDDDDVEETVKAPPAKKVKTSTKKKKDVKPAAKKKTKKQAQSPEKDDFINDSVEQELSNEESSDSEDDEKDDDFDKDGVEDGDDENDLDFKEEEGNKAKSSKMKKATSVSKEAISKPKEGKEKKQKAAKPPPEPRDSADEDRLAKRRERDRLRKSKQDEVKAYEKCVLIFKGVVTELRNAIEKEDTAKMVECMKEIKDNVKDFSAPFIELFKLAPLIKSAKAILTGRDDMKVRKDLWEELKVVYNAKRLKVPEGWKDFLKSEKGEPKRERAKSEVKKTPKVKRLSQDSEDKMYQNGGGKSENVKGEQAPSLDRSSHGNNRQSLDSQDRVAAPKSKRDEPPGSIHASTKPRVDSSTPLAPSRKTDSKRDESTGSSIKQRVASSVQLSATKAPKRKTSLTSLKFLLNKDVKTPTNKSENKPAVRKSLEPVLVVKKLPEWLTKDLVLDLAVESHETRSLGLEFFLESSEPFPSIVNQASLARALESATYAWAKEQKTESWEEAYWGKVHMIVGSIAGKHRAGSLMAAIVDGKHQYAKSVIGLSDDKLLTSFEGGQNGCY